MTEQEILDALRGAWGENGIDGDKISRLLDTLDLELILETDAVKLCGALPICHAIVFLKDWIWKHKTSKNGVGDFNAFFDRNPTFREYFAREMGNDRYFKKFGDRRHKMDISYCDHVAIGHILRISKLLLKVKYE